MTRIQWVLILLSLVAIGGMIARLFSRPEHRDKSFERRAFIERDVQTKCAIAEERSLAFRKRFPRSTDATKTKDPQKNEWESVQSAQRDCQAVQALLDSPLPIETYQRDVEKACGELKKRQEAFKRQFPTEEPQKDNDAALNSSEWKAVMEWEQACDTARADLDEAKKQLDHENRAVEEAKKQ